MNTSNDDNEFCYTQMALNCPSELCKKNYICYMR